jgi:hypothetical protein
MEGRAKVTKDVRVEGSRFIPASVLAEGRCSRQNRVTDLRRAALPLLLLVPACAWQIQDRDVSRMSYGFGPVTRHHEVAVTSTSASKFDFAFLLKPAPRCERMAEIVEYVEEKQYSPGRRTWGERGAFWGTLVMLAGASLALYGILGDETSVPLIVGGGVTTVGGLTWVIVGPAAARNAHRTVESKRRAPNAMIETECPYVEEFDWSQVDFASAKMIAPWGETYEAEQWFGNSGDEIIGINRVRKASGEPYVSFSKKRDRTPDPSADPQDWVGRPWTLHIGGQTFAHEPSLEFTVDLIEAGWIEPPSP